MPVNLHSVTHTWHMWGMHVHLCAPYEVTGTNHVASSAVDIYEPKVNDDKMEMHRLHQFISQIIIIENWLQSKDNCLSCMPQEICYIKGVFSETGSVVL